MGYLVCKKKNRGCYNESLPITWANRIWPSQHFKMTVSKETLSDYADGIVYFIKRKILVQPTIALGIEWGIRDAIIYRNQLAILCSFYLENRHIKPIPLFIRPIISLLDKTTQKNVVEKEIEQLHMI